jgi:hypothetical protein
MSQADWDALPLPPGSRVSQMSGAARSMLGFGVYLVVMGGGLLFFPELPCRILVLPAASHFWLRLNGMFCWVLAYYCFRAAREEAKIFMAWSVWPRSSTIVFMAVFVAMGLVGPMALLIGAVDSLAAIWTALALKADARRTRSS